MLDGLFDTGGLEPHGICLLWRRDIFWPLAASDGIIALAYISISVVIFFYVAKRRDEYFRSTALAFALFIVLCGMSHATDVWTLWVPQYGIEVVVKALTAAVSLATAVMLWPLLPKALALPSAAQLAEANAALSREVAERRNAEASLREVERQLRAANAELESFAYAVSHDLRTPLRAMTGFSTALIEDFGDRLDGEARGYLDAIVEGGRHMGGLIQGLLALSRISRAPLQAQWIDVSKLAEGIRAELAAAGAGREAAWDIEPGLTVHGDPRLVETVVRNLLENAAKYTSETADAAIRVFADHQGGRRTICVADNGAGFDMAHAAKLFQPFQRMHRQDEFPGIGIGLSTVSRIVHRHGGTITAEGAVAKGATFRLWLPDPGETGEGGLDHAHTDDPAGRGHPSGRNADPAGVA